MEEKTVLIIEDNDLNVKLVRSILKINGIPLIEAKNAEDGIDLAREHKPALILMDIQLPGMDGFSATKIIKKDPDINQTPVIALTAYAMEEDKQKAKNAGCDFFISKPIDTKIFLKTIKETLDIQSDSEKLQETKSTKYNSRVLIVDDVPENVKLLTASLASEGYVIDPAYGGKEAIEKVKNMPPDLILLDIMMPEMDGYEVTSILKNDPKTRDIPIILVTSLNDPDDKAKGMEAGADEYLTKPVNRTELLTRMRSMIRLKQYQDQLTIRDTKEFPIGKKISDKSDKADHEKAISEQRVLLVDDNDKDISLIRSLLQNEPYELIIVKTGEDALSYSRHQKVDLVLLDILLPGINGMEVCQQIKDREETKDLQVVIITCLDDLETKLKGIELGADDFLVKPINQREIIARVKALLRKKSYIDKLHSHYEMAMGAAISDGLTGLYNHVYFKHFLDLEIKKSLRQEYPVVLIMMDIDNFKTYNDKLGHTIGDIILRELAAIIKENIREIDFPSRYGGEEFALVLPYADKNIALSVSKRIMDAIYTNNLLYETTSSVGRITLSVGIARCPQDCRDPVDLIQKADTMLYKAKKEGKNRICIMDMETHLNMDLYASN